MDSTRSIAHMAITSKYIFAASMDVAPDKEALFNEVYDIEHDALPISSAFPACSLPRASKGRRSP